MSVQRILSWQINSINQERQEVLRSVDGLPAETIATLSATDTGYIDTEDYPMTTGVAYQIASIATIKGVESRAVSEAVELTVDGGENIPDSDFTKATYIKTDTSNPMWIETEYAPENINGELHIDWGDGATEVLNIADFETDGYFLYLEHEYAVNGEYVVKVYSTTKANYTGFGEITKVTDWGSPSSLRLYFSSANLIEVPSTLHPALNSLQDMFYKASNFNQDISMWDTSNVTNMSGMFHKAAAFNQPIGNWNTSNVTTMTDMFKEATSFNQDISMWDTSNVAYMYAMFRFATSFNADISGWDVSNVVNMAYMFYNATAFNQDISGWNVSNVTNMEYMFYVTTSFNQDISGWNTANVTDMSYMFQNATAFNGDISSWDTGNVVNVASMFASAFAFNSDISGWDTGKVTSMSYMFYNATAFNQNLSQWCVPWIYSTPYYFSNGATLFTTDKHPVWGTCPRGENAQP